MLCWRTSNQNICIYDVDSGARTTSAVAISNDSSCFSIPLFTL